MGVQRQVIGKQTDAAAEQRRQAPGLHAGYPRILAFPEIAVVDQDQIGPSIHRRVHQGLARSNTGHHALDAVPALHLQAVGTVVLKTLCFQQLIAVADQITQFRHVFPSLFRLVRHALSMVP